MSQSGFIAAMLLAAFILWLAINDRLTTYTAVLFGPTQQPTPQGNISNKNGIIAPSAVGSAASPAGTAAAIPDQSNIIDSTATDVTGAGGFLEEVAPFLLEAF